MLRNSRHNATFITNQPSIVRKLWNERSEKPVGLLPTVELRNELHEVTVHFLKSRDRRRTDNVPTIIDTLSTSLCAMLEQSAGIP